MKNFEPPTVLTIGHSTHTYEHFLGLLRSSSVTAIADVRSSPFSRHFPQFNRDTLKAELRMDGISYSFLGFELGGRPTDRTLYRDGMADYEKMALTREFLDGLDRIVVGAKKYRIALMCSERDPLDCHRCLLVARTLVESRAIPVRHILGDGSIVTQAEVEESLLEMTGRGVSDLFASREDRLAAAYRDRARRVAFAKPQPDPKGPLAAE